MAVARVLGFKIHWLGKQSLFRFPFGGLFRAFGGIAVDRSKRSKTVDALVDLLNHQTHYVLAIPAEGTRSRGTHWKSGFYHVARGANVPVALGWLDYRKREGGIGTPIELSGDMKKDMDRIRAFYSGIIGKFPENFTTPRLVEEDAQ